MFSTLHEVMVLHPPVQRVAACSLPFIIVCNPPSHEVVAAAVGSDGGSISIPTIAVLAVTRMIMTVLS